MNETKNNTPKGKNLDTTNQSQTPSPVKPFDPSKPFSAEKLAEIRERMKEFNKPGGRGDQMTQEFIQSLKRSNEKEIAERKERENPNE